MVRKKNPFTVTYFQYFLNTWCLNGTKMFDVRLLARQRHFLNWINNTKGQFGITLTLRECVSGDSGRKKNQHRRTENMLSPHRKASARKQTGYLLAVNWAKQWNGSSGEAELHEEFLSFGILPLSHLRDSEPEMCFIASRSPTPR